MVHRIEKTVGVNNMKSIKSLEDLKGLTITEVSGGDVGDEEVYITFDDGNTLKMFHSQDCCESVSIYEVDNDISNLVGGVVNSFYESVSDADGIADDSGTWTFYNINTSKGSVNIRWLGSSNGYYSESVNIEVYPYSYDSRIN